MVEGQIRCWGGAPCAGAPLLGEGSAKEGEPLVRGAPCRQVVEPRRGSALRSAGLGGSQLGLLWFERIDLVRAGRAKVNHS